ncbi:MAG: outer membrane beta-barrel protein [Acidobacteria bacterium]|nr:outer membrane beta-barrel protein [Acidobacteriota bacterium]
MRKNIYVSLLVGLMLLFSFTAFAQEEPVKKSSGFTLSANIGYHIITNSDISDSWDHNIAFGANAGFMITPEIELTAGLSLFSTMDSVLELFDLDQTFILFGGYYHLGKDALDPKIGAGLLLGSYDMSGITDDSGLGAWFAAGLNYCLGGGLFIGGEARYYLLSIEESDLGGLEVLFVIGVKL